MICTTSNSIHKQTKLSWHHPAYSYMGLQVHIEFNWINNPIEPPLLLDLKLGLFPRQRLGVER